ncbi:MAG: type I restriction enzyme HsdR N-terminal domain-containing protein [Verrucomicrobiota bacterium]
MKINIAHELKKYWPLLLEAQQNNLSEADTLQRIVKVFENVLGYDLGEISREFEVKCNYVDLAIKIDGIIKFFVEVKAAGKKLRERHVAQGEFYAALGNMRWVLVTNGVEWKLYHLTFDVDEGVDFVPVFSESLAPETIEKSAEMLAYLHRNSVKVGALEKFWEHQSALSADSIGKAVFTEDVLRLIRKEIRRRQGILIDVEDLGQAIHDLFTPDARELIGPLKIHYNKRAVKQTEVQPADAGDSTAASETLPQSSDKPDDSPGVEP